MFLVDSHCHLDLLDLKEDNGDLNLVIARAEKNHVHHILNVCVSITEFPTVLKTAEAYSYVSASVGLHPNESTEIVTEDQLIALADHPKVIAIGETGLDYFRSTGDLDWQRDRFRAHIGAAKTTKKPLIIHMRDATEDTLAIMQEENAIAAGGIMHCFSEDWEVAKRALDLGFYISISGIVTFKNAHKTQEVAQKAPADRLLIETDAPYLTPMPHRGKTNEPSYVRHTAEFIANLRHEPLEKFAEQTTNNFFELFKGAKRHHV